MQSLFSFSASWRDPCPSLRRAAALLLIILALEATAILLRLRFEFRPVYLLTTLRIVDLAILLALGPWDFSRSHVKLGLKIAAPVAVLLGLAGALFLISWEKYFGHPLFKVSPIIRDSSGFPLAAFLLASCLLGPLVEEFVFRGILYRSARERLPALVCALVVSLVFAGLHFGLGQNPLVPFCGSLVFCLVYEKAKSILSPTLVHIAGNLLIYLFPLLQFSRAF
jgi:membrane protease YdiL (CAAX protease family)